MSRITHAISLFLLFLFLIPAVSAAGDLVIYTGVNKERAKSAVKTYTGSSISDESLLSLVDTALPIEGDIWFVGASTAAECAEGGAAVSSDFDLWIELAESALSEMQWEAARLVFADITAGIPCAKEMLTAEQLAVIMRLFGILEAWDGHEEAALTRYRQSVMLLGRPAWDDDYPPILKRLYDQAVSEVESLGRIDINYLLSDFNLAELSIDGTSLSNGESVQGAIRVLPGEHVIQWREGDTELQTRVVNVPKQAYLVTTAGMQQLLAERPGDDATNLVQETFFSRQDGTVSILVWDKEEDQPEFLYQYDRTKAEPVRYVVGAKKDLTMRQREARFGAIGFNLAGGYIYHGLSSINIAVSADFRLKDFFLLQMGGDFSFTTYVGLKPEDNRTYMQPAVRVGAKFELRPNRPLKPYILVLGRIEFSEGSSSRAGPVLGAGVNFTATNAMAVTLEVTGGPQFWTDQPVSGYVQALVGITLREARWEE